MLQICRRIVIDSTLKTCQKKESILIISSQTDLIGNIPTSAEKVFASEFVKDSQFKKKILAWPHGANASLALFLSGISPRFWEVMWGKNSRNFAPVCYESNYDLRIFIDGDGNEFALWI